MQVLTGNAASAIAFRNAVFKVVPFAMVQPIYDAAVEVAKGTLDTLVKRRDKAIEYFRSMGVKDAQITETLCIKKIEDIDLDKLATLNGFRSAIKNGESTVKDIFERVIEKVTIEDLSLLLELKRVNLTPDEEIDADRIIKNKEEANYVKLQKMLMSK